MSIADSNAHIRKFVDRYLAAWNGHRSEDIVDLVTEDVVWFDPALIEPARGPEEVRRFMETCWMTFPDLIFSYAEPEHLTVTSDTVAWAYHFAGTMRGPIEPAGWAPTNRAMELDGVDLFQLRDGRIAHYRTFYDPIDLAQQLGIAPPPGSRTERTAVALQRLKARLK